MIKHSKFKSTLFSYLVKKVCGKWGCWGRYISHLVDATGKARPKTLLKKKQWKTDPNLIWLVFTHFILKWISFVNLINKPAQTHAPSTHQLLLWWCNQKQLKPTNLKKLYEVVQPNFKWTSINALQTSNLNLYVQHMPLNYSYSPFMRQISTGPEKKYCFILHSGKYFVNVLLTTFAKDLVCYLIFYLQ